MRGSLRRAGPWVTPALVLVEVVLVWTGRLSLANAVIVIAAVEVALAVAAIGRARAALRSFRAAGAAGRDPWGAAEDGLAEMLPRRAARVLLIEVRVWVCLGRWLARRRPADPCFEYGSGLRPLLWAVLGLVVVEGAVLDTVLAVILGRGSPWVWVAFGLHLYGLVWIAGFLAALRTEPHRVGGDALYLHDSVFGVVRVPLASVTSVAARRRSGTGRSGFRTEGTVAQLAYGDATVRLHLDPGAEPLTAAGSPRPGLTAIDVTADAPAPFVDAVRAGLPASR